MRVSPAIDCRQNCTHPDHESHLQHPVHLQTASDKLKRLYRKHKQMPSYIERTIFMNQHIQQMQDDREHSRCKPATDSS